MLISGKKIIWALDPFVQNSNINKIAGQHLQVLAKNLGVQVEPVFSMVPNPATILGGQGKLLSVHEFEEISKQRLEEVSKKAKIPNMLPSKVIPNKLGGSRGAVEAIHNYALRTSANGIAVTTHARKGISRLFFGSFAETLLLTSRIPVLTFNPESKVNKKMVTVLFPTDFSPACQKVLELVVPMVKKAGGKLVLYYHPVNEQALVNMLAVGPTNAWAEQANDLLAQSRREMKQKVEELGEQVRLQGIRAEAVFGSGKGDLSSGILSQAKKSAVDMIIMTCQSGKLGAAVLGSATRQVVRASPVPVLVQHVFENSKTLFELSEDEKRSLHLGVVE